MARQAGAQHWPQVSLEGSASRSKTVIDIGPVENESTRSNFSLGATAGYEVDLWRKIDARKRGAALDVEVTRETLEATALTLVAHTAKLWYIIIEQKALLDILEEQIEVSRTFLELVELRFAQGVASAVEVYQQRQQLAAVEANVPRTNSRLEVSMHQLATLLGHPPLEKLAVPANTLPVLPPLPSTGVPADLLSRRPDVRAAEFQIVAADYRVAAAIAERLPSLNLMGNLSYRDEELEDLFDNWLWSIAANLVAPVIDGGRRKAEVARAQSIVRERTHYYAQSIIEALREVEDALVKERYQRQYLTQLNDRITIAEKNLKASRRRYVNGQTDYLSVLTALQSLQNLQKSSITETRTLISIRIELYEALGGSWTQTLEPSKNDKEEIVRLGEIQ